MFSAARPAQIRSLPFFSKPDYTSKDFTKAALAIQTFQVRPRSPEYAALPSVVQKCIDARIPVYPQETVLWYACHCLEYVSSAFGLPLRYPLALAGFHTCVFDNALQTPCPLVLWLVQGADQFRRDTGADIQSLVLRPQHSKGLREAAPQGRASEAGLLTFSQDLVSPQVSQNMVVGMLNENVSVLLHALWADGRLPPEALAQLSAVGDNINVAERLGVLARALWN